jgi:hypothetical protein
MFNIEIIMFTIFVFGLAYFFWYITSITGVNEQGINIRFVPFAKKKP